MILKSDAKFKEKRLVVSNMTMNLVNFHPATQNLTTQYRGVTFHDTEQWCEIWINLDFVVSKLEWEWAFIKLLKNLKICTLMNPFCPKRNVLKVDAKFKWKLTRGLKNDKEFA